MSEADHAGDARPDEPTDDRKLIDELIFRQYLDEVHLLMDFVSGRADRSLAMLTMPNPAAPGETMTSGRNLQGHQRNALSAGGRTARSTRKTPPSC